MKNQFAAFPDFCFLRVEVKIMKSRFAAFPDCFFSGSRPKSSKVDLRVLSYCFFLRAEVKIDLRSFFYPGLGSRFADFRMVDLRICSMAVKKIPFVNFL